MGHPIRGPKVRRSAHRQDMMRTVLPGQCDGTRLLTLLARSLLRLSLLVGCILRHREVHVLHVPPELPIVEEVLGLLSDHVDPAADPLELRVG